MDICISLPRNAQYLFIIRTQMKFQRPTKCYCFKLPSARVLKYKWIRPLHRDMATELPEDKIFICIHHFREEDIIRADRTVQADGFLGQLIVLIK